MKFCTKCGSQMIDQSNCPVCGKRAYGAPPLAAAYPPAGNLPPFTYAYAAPLLGLLERERRVVVPFSYINGTLVEVRAYEDVDHPVRFRVWSERDDPRSGPQSPIVGRESQPSIRSILRLWLADGAARSFVLANAKLRSRPGNPLTLIFPVQVERAANPLYDYAAVAAVDYAANDFAWSTANPEIHALRSRLPEDQCEPFGDSMASYLNGLCRRCLRQFGPRAQQQRQYQMAASHAELSR